MDPCGTIADMSTTPSTSLTVSVPSHVDAFIKEQVASGNYSTADDIVCAALALLRDRRQQMREAVIDEIRREIEIGIAQADAGQVRDGEEVFREIRARRGL